MNIKCIKSVTRILINLIKNYYFKRIYYYFHLYLEQYKITYINLMKKKKKNIPF